MNTLKPAPGARKDHRRVGRGIGSGLGKTCRSRPQGPVRARTGKGKVKAGFEGGQMPLQRRLPKVGFRSKLAKDTAEVVLYQLGEARRRRHRFRRPSRCQAGPHRTAKHAKIVKKGELTKVALKGVDSRRRRQRRHRSRRRQQLGVIVVVAGIESRWRRAGAASITEACVSACCSSLGVIVYRLGTLHPGAWVDPAAMLRVRFAKKGTIVRTCSTCSRAARCSGSASSRSA